MQNSWSNSNLCLYLNLCNLKLIIVINENEGARSFTIHLFLIFKI